MSIIVLRSVKGSILTNAEVDANFNNLNTDKVEAANPTFTGQASFAAGSTSAPSLVPTGDTNTGVAFPASDNVTISTSGAEALRVDSSGNITLGGTSTTSGFNVTRTASVVNRITAKGSLTAADPSLTATGTDANVGVEVSSKGTGHITFKSATNTNTQMRIRGDNTAVNWFDIFGGVTASSFGPTLRAEGSDANVPVSISTKGNSPIGFLTNQGTLQFQVSHVASAVNFAQTFGGVSGYGATLKAVGADVNVDLNLDTKGTGKIYLRGNGIIGGIVYGVPSAVNALALRGSTALNAVSLSAEGTDADISIDAIPKGQGGFTVNVGSGNSTGALYLFQTGTNGANFKITGDGATTPNKTIRVAGGQFQILNSAYSNVIFSLSDVGFLTILGGITATGSASSFAANSTVAGLEIGTKIVPQTVQNANYTLVASDSGGHQYHTTGTHTWTIPANGSVAYPIGTAITFVNDGGTVNIAITTDTLVLAGAGTTGTRTLAANGMATALKVSATRWFISGSGLS